MADSFQSFDARLNGLERKHRKLARGYRNVVHPDGLIEMRPVFRLHVPIKGIMLLLLGFLTFKAVVFAALGPASYEARVDALAQSTSIESFGAWFMQVDPATEFVGLQLRPLFR
ncbi:hypothetical protein [Pseudaestuariivita sp.]|uniref:hypothetical protein n=1 Tax=Pseudaestuariivita sp. TaxID=2211669 RepID=UPI0040582DEA